MGTYADKIMEHSFLAPGQYIRLCEGGEVGAGCVIANTDGNLCVFVLQRQTSSSL